MTNWLYALAAFLILAAGIIIYLYYLNTRRTMDTIAGMLEAAINGTFSEHKFDESRLSALETKFAHYLSSSEVSARNLAKDRDKIKTLISDISHQTKTPIANLLLYSELLQEQQLSDEARGYVDALHAQSQKLYFLIDFLVKLSRLENGILKLTPRQDALQPMLDKVWEQLHPKAEAKGLTLRLEPTDCTACFDARWTDEALCNIVDNAIKYTETGGVSISVTAYELFVCIEVTDSGTGISEEEQAKVFSRFYRAPEAAGTEGIGIGLYLAREIVAGQGGYIRVASAKGRGSTFAVFLPR